MPERAQIMYANRVVLKRLSAAAIVLSIAIADRIVAWLLGSEPFLSIDGAGSGTALLVWAFGHCDGMDGPVVKAAKEALDTRNVNLVLPWVRPEREMTIREAFDHALGVRGLGAEAKELADMHFFETLVRIHRAGEGEPYTGIKAAGRDLGPAIPAADKALETGSPDALVKLLTDVIRQGVHERFHGAVSHRYFDVNDVGAGRAYVESYVAFVHYVEQLWHAASAQLDAHHAVHAGASPGEHGAQAPHVH